MLYSMDVLSGKEALADLEGQVNLYIGLVTTVQNLEIMAKKNII